MLAAEHQVVSRTESSVGKKTYTAKEGFRTTDLLHFGLDHLKAARLLFQASYETFDSAGHLAHLGTELLLKAVLLSADGEFPNEHDLLKLVEAIRVHKPSFLKNPDLEAIVAHINPFVVLRYPDAKGSKSIGDEDWDQVKRLRDAILEESPQDLEREIRKIDPTKKGGRTLMELPKVESST
jgi:HEPN domain-containing protein